MTVTELPKPARNNEFRIMEFVRPDGMGQLNGDEVITAAAITVTERRTGVDVTADMISDVAPYNQIAVRYRLRGGVKGKSYLMEIVVTTSNGQDLTEYRQVNII